MSKSYHLYFDDTGSRDPDHNVDKRNDHMNCFGLGGILVKEEDIDTIFKLHKELCAKWEIDTLRSAVSQYLGKDSPEGVHTILLSLFVPFVNFFVFSLGQDQC